MEPKLAYLVNRAEHDAAAARRLAYDVDGRGPYVIRLAGRELDVAARPDDVLYLLYRDCYGRVLTHFRSEGWLAVHAGLVTIAGRRLIVLGHKGAGKTTLLTRLLVDGHAVEGDEMVFTRDGSVVALPRPFHLKPGIELLVPELADRLDGLPWTSTDDGSRIVALDPQTAGYDWHLVCGPVDGVVELTGDAHTESALEVVSSVELVRRLVPYAFPHSGSRPALLRACARLAANAKGAILTRGSVMATAAQIVDFAILAGV